MRVAIPVGSTHGWGIAGTWLAREMAKLPPLDGVTLHCVAGHHFAPSDESQWGRINIGYCFFEHELVAYRFMPEAARRWDHIVAGSSWCEHHLKIGGMLNSSTILQGIDPQTFHQMSQRPADGRFVVFSGGKFEFRKGHDLVIAAMRVFMARHPNVWLSCAWHNHWPQSIQTMEQSRHIPFRYRELPPEQLYRELLAENGIDTSRVMLYPVLDNSQMPAVYADADVGLFPNRCEGGNNMVMCEFMACGRPVIASCMTGHQDVMSPEHALCLSVCEPIVARLGDEPSGVWFEPQVEEIVYLLEQAYADQPGLQLLGNAAAHAMTALSWSEAARAFHRIGEQLLAGQRGVTEVASVVSPPDFTQANRLFSEEKFDEAEVMFRSLLAHAPFDPSLHNALATVLDRLERYPEAILHYEKALALRADFVEARFNLANTLKRMGGLVASIEALNAVVASKPDFVEAWQNLALCLFEEGKLSGAAEALRRVLNIRPDCSKSRTDLGEILIEMQRFEDAVACFEVVLASEPRNSAVLNSMGIALQELGALERAEGCYRQILMMAPDNIQALNNLGTLLKSRCRLDQAESCFNQALSYLPDDGQVTFNRSLVRLLQGDFVRGWPDYERRFERAEPVVLLHDDLPRWQGEPLAGRRLLVQSEQGYGDTFQFVRYLALLKGAGGPIVFECQDASVKAALYGLSGAETVIARGEQLPLPVDLQIPLLSLPGLFGTDFQSIPFPGGYLQPDPMKLRHWGEQLGRPDGRIRVGLVWGGRKTRLDADRSMQLADLEPLMELPGVRLISLQIGGDADQLEAYRGRVEDFGCRIRDFGDTAALLANLDLLITIDTAIAHLAGALGVKTWVMLKYSPDWRWFLHREDSPWYASSTLFRQESDVAGWDFVVKKIVTKFSKMEVGLIKNELKG